MGVLWGALGHLSMRSIYQVCFEPRQNAGIVNQTQTVLRVKFVPLLIEKLQTYLALFTTSYASGCQLDFAKNLLLHLLRRSTL